jgi:hypothetical protein
LINISRPMFWIDVADNLVDIVALLARHVPRFPGAVGALITAAGCGLMNAFGPSEKNLAVLAVIIIVEATDLTAEAGAPAIEAIQQVAAHHDLEPLAALRANLIQVLADPDSSFAMSVPEAREGGRQAVFPARTPGAWDISRW